MKNWSLYLVKIKYNIKVNLIYVICVDSSSISDTAILFSTELFGKIEKIPLSNRNI